MDRIYVHVEKYFSKTTVYFRKQKGGKYSKSS